VDNEAKRLKMLNRKGIGPLLLFAGKDHFAYRFVEGAFIEPFVAGAGRKSILKVLKEVFLQMRALDKLGLNKEEMHHPLKHVVVTPRGKAVLLDFERCRPGAKVHNVTQFCQFLRSTAFNALLRERGVSIDGERLMALAKAYSHEMTEKRFKDILALLR
jgi:putative serine/threonine protein kinase